MIIKNYLTQEPVEKTSHQGVGVIRQCRLFTKQDFETDLAHMAVSQVLPGASIGYHTHGKEEEVYVVLEGKGIMTINGVKQEVGEGDVILNKFGWSHGLENPFQNPVKLLIFNAKRE